VISYNYQVVASTKWHQTCDRESEDGRGSNEDEDEGADKGEDEDGDGDRDGPGDQRILSMLGYRAL